MAKKVLGWEDGICDDPDHPEYHGMPCDCAGCRPTNHCIPDAGGCSECDGPVQGCDYTEKDDVDDVSLGEG